MGNALSFQKEYSKLNDIVSHIINEKDLFKNKSYNFLNEDVCTKYHVVFEKDLEKHLKIDVANLGVYFFPKEESGDGRKRDICKKVAGHYIKILYILCLIKYIYDLENNGENSFAHIVFRNIDIVDGIMRIRTCELPQKDYSEDGKMKIDFKQLKGLDFFVTYFLKPTEARTFASVMRGVLGRESKGQLARRLCSAPGAVKKLFGAATETCDEPSAAGAPNMHFFIEKFNPIFSGYYCGSPVSVNIKLGNADGRKVKKLFDTLSTNYAKNLQHVHHILEQLVTPDYHLRDISKGELDAIIAKTKDIIQLFYLQTLLDYQHMIDVALKVPNSMRLQ